MDKRALRIGDWVQDATNGYEIQISLVDLQYAYVFEPIFLSSKYLGEFGYEEMEGRKIYHKEEGLNVVTLEDLGEKWRLSIHTAWASFEGTIRYVSDLQHFLSDCQIYWKIGCGCGEKR